MLCDTVAGSIRLPVAYPGIKLLLDQVKAAQKFVLSPDFTAACDGLLDNQRELERIAPFCRLPYPLTWIECAQGDRPKFTSVPLRSALEAPVIRVGFLMCAIDQRLSSWATALFWTLRDVPELYSQNVSVISMKFDTENAPFEGATLLERISRPHYTSFGKEIIANAKLAGVEDELMEQLVLDWGGETRFLIAALGLLNARNVAEYQPVDQTAHNRKRAKHGRPPLSSHTILKIRAVHRPSLLPARSSIGARQEEVRAHFVRGHFKHRRSGIFWWGPHMRGSALAGLVTHDYEVT